MLEARTLETALESGEEVTIITINGYQTKCRITDFDCDVIIARVNGRTWMIYRHAVSTIILY